MKVTAQATKAEAVQWVGQQEAQPTGEWCTERGYEKLDRGSNKMLPSLDLIPDGEIPPNGIEYVTELVGADNIRLSGHGLRVLTRAGWTPVAEGDYIVRNDYGVNVVSAEEFEASYKVASK